MKYGLDAAFPPSAAQAHTARNLGWDWCGVYVGGPRSSNTWSQSTIARCRYAGFDVLPIYVGLNAPWDSPDVFSWQSGADDGAQALECLQVAGLESCGILALDMESRTYDAAPEMVELYLLGFVSVLNSDDARVVLYSDAPTIAAIGSTQNVDFTWGAAWVPHCKDSTVAPRGRFDPAMLPPWDAWQFCGNSRIEGWNVDFNSARDDLPLVPSLSTG